MHDFTLIFNLLVLYPHLGLHGVTQVGCPRSSIDRNQLNNNFYKNLYYYLLT